MADHFVFVTLIVQEVPEKKALETPGGAEMKSAMGGEKAGLPFYFFLDKDGQKIGNSMSMPNGGNIGHPANAEEIKAFVELLKRTAPRMTDAERAQIADYLTKTIPRPK